MPELPITSEGELLPDAPERTLAVMLFPFQKEKQRHLLALAYQYTHAYAGEPVPAATTLAILEGGGQLDTKKKIIDGRKVGELLLIVQQLAQHRPADASLSKARHLLARHYRRNHENASDTALKSAWRNYHVVSALWAAYLLNPYALERYGRKKLGFDNRKFLDFLSLAQNLAEFGKRHVSKGVNTTPLLTGDTYTPPDFLTLPKVEISLSDIDPQIAKDLAEYTKKERGNL